MDRNGFFTLIVIILLGLGLYWGWRRNRYMLFTGLYSVGMLLATCLSLHTFWNQDRLVIPFAAMLFGVMIYGLYKGIEVRNLSVAKPILAGVTGLLLLVQLVGTLKETGENSIQLSHARKGDLYYGYAPPIATYLQAAEWAGNNLPDSSQVLVRKPAEAVVYSGKIMFTRLWSGVPDQPDELIGKLKERHITHLLYDEAGLGDGKAVSVLNSAHPQMLVPVQQWQTPAPAILIQLNYDK